MRRYHSILPVAVLATLAAPLLAQPDKPPRRVVAMLAHPDDELPLAPALAALARQGDFVTIIHATPGDAGPGVSGLSPGPELAEIRRGEAECAGRALGAAVIGNLGFGDGLLAEQARLSARQPESLEAAVAEHLAGADLVLSWGPDGGYGHADHRMISAVTTQAIQAMPAQDRPLLLYFGIRTGTLPPVADLQDWAVTDPALLADHIAYTAVDLAAARAAAQCHATQFTAEQRAGLADLFDQSVWQGAVHFRRAF